MLIFLDQDNRIKQLKEKAVAYLLELFREKENDIITVENTARYCTIGFNDDAKCVYDVSREMVTYFKINGIEIHTEEIEENKIREFNNTIKRFYEKNAVNILRNKNKKIKKALLSFMK